uniref:NADH-ubiquinone oxidoreductase chain 4L n=1 Tax=Cucujoidea sp. 24 KM-2017 TaxID=2219361 RepID=A0A346RHW0_9CUCU|nr:NADH dehydrogenase subunit 4L [Cucujoidea sp. 24 KM-2017]
MKILISGLFMILGGLLSFSMNRKHLLTMLLSLEFVILSLFLVIFNYLLILGNELYFSMVFMTLSVCEGVLGLSVLVLMIRTHGNDYFKSFNMLW